MAKGKVTINEVICRVAAFVYLFVLRAYLLFLQQKSIPQVTIPQK